MMSDQAPLILEEGGNSIEYMAGVLEQERALVRDSLNFLELPTNIR